MSYTKTYRGYKLVTGSVSYSYPASEYGGTGTAYYSEEVPIDISVTVDTSSFDHSVGRAETRIDGLTGAVTAMNAAQIASIKAGAEKVSNSLVNGFYNLIQHDVTSKQSDANNLLQSKVGVLLADSKALTSAHERMKRDLERLKAHYGAIFRGLDEDLDKRIKELDRACFRLGQNGRDEVIYDPFLTYAAETVDAIGQNTRSFGLISAARLKHNLTRVISLMSGSVKKSRSYKDKIRSILWQDPDNQASQSYMPVAYSVTNDAQNGYGCVSCAAGAPVRSQAVLSSVYSYVSSAPPQAGRPVAYEEMNLIDQAFSGLVEERSRAAQPDNEYEQRVYAAVKRMWQQDQQHLRQL